LSNTDREVEERDKEERGLEAGRGGKGKKEAQGYGM